MCNTVIDSIADFADTRSNINLTNEKTRLTPDRPPNPRQSKTLNRYPV